MLGIQPSRTTMGRVLGNQEGFDEEENLGATKLCVNTGESLVSEDD